MKKITICFTSVLITIFFLGASALSSTVLAITPESSRSELSIPPDIGIEISHTEPSVPIVGIIMWAIVAVCIVTALIVIFSNSRGSDINQDATVHRKRYHKKKAPKGKLLGDKYYRK